MLDCVLAAIGPIAYGAAVAGVYPWKALKLDEMYTLKIGERERVCVCVCIYMSIYLPIYI
jgi:hypothetical protein